MDIEKLIRRIKDEYDKEVSKKRSDTDKSTKLPGYKRLQLAGENASKAGIVLADAVIRNLTDQYLDGVIPEEDSKAIVVDSLQHNYKNVSREAADAQKAILEDAEVGINPIIPIFNKDRAEGIAVDIARMDDFRKHHARIRNNVKNHSRNIVDESIKQNAKVHQELGLEPRVTRIYDGVGLHKGKNVCKWCEERAGTDMPYGEAYAKGSFQRHPGCGCEILYKVGKQIQRQSDWTRNEWEEVILERRRSYGVPPVYVKNKAIESFTNTEEITAYFPEIHFYKNFNKLNIETQKEIAQGFDFMRNHFGIKAMPKKCGATEQTAFGRTIMKQRKINFLINLNKGDAFSTACHECVHVFDYNNGLLSFRMHDKIIQRLRAEGFNNKQIDNMKLQILGYELYLDYHQDMSELMAYSFEECLYGNNNRFIELVLEELERVKK